MTMIPDADLRREKAVRLLNFVSEYLSLVDGANLGPQMQHVLRLDEEAIAPSSGEPGMVLRLSRPQTLPHPVPPACFRNWVDEAQLSDPHQAPPRIRGTATFPSSIASEGGQVAHEVRFLEDYPALKAEWADYLDKLWVPWAGEAAKAAIAMARYANLACMYLELHQDSGSWEAVLSPLELCSVRGGEGVRRHVASQLLRLELDETSETLSASMAKDEGLDLERELLHFPGVSRAHAGQLVQGLHSLSGLDLADICGAVEAMRESQPTFAAEVSMVTNPAIVLRRRGSADMQRMADCAARVLADPAVPLPQAMLDCMLGVGERGVGRGGPAALALPLRASGEQVALVRAAGKERCVIVKTVPGPGRSHSIANLVCSLLADGRSVLVSARTPQAVTAIFQSMPASVRRLWNQAGRCGWVIDSGTAGGQAQAEAEVGAEAQAFADAEARLHRAERELADLREAQARSHQLAGGYTGTPSELSVLLADSRSALGWLPFAPEALEACPISNAKAEGLLQLIRAANTRHGDPVGDLSIGLSDMPPPRGFDALVRREANDREALAEFLQSAESPVVEAIAGEEDAVVSFMAGVLAKFRDLFAELSADPTPWVREAALDIFAGRRARWSELWAATRRYLHEIEAYPRSIIDLEVAGLDGRNLHRVSEDSKVLLDHLAQGGGLGFPLFRSRAVREAMYITTDVFLAGEWCNTPDKIRILARWADVGLRLKRLGDYWRLHMMAESEPPRVRLAEYAARLVKLQACMDLDELRRRLQDLLLRYEDHPAAASVGFSWPWSHAQGLTDWAGAVEYINRRRRLGRSRGALDALVLRAARSPVLKEALEARDYAMYLRAYAGLEAALADDERAARRDAALLALGASGDRGGRLVRQYGDSPDDAAWSGRYANFVAAWDWARARRQLRALGSRREQPVLAARRLQAGTFVARAGFVLSRNRQYTAFERQAEPSSSSVLGSGQTIAGKAREVSRLRGEVRLCAEALACKGASCARMAPIWALPSLLADCGPGAFDVGVVDEADLVGPEGLLFQYFTTTQVVFSSEAPSVVLPDMTSHMPRLRQEYLAGLAIGPMMRRRVSYAAVLESLWGRPMGIAETAPGPRVFAMRYGGATAEGETEAVARRAADLIRGQTVAVVALSGSPQARRVAERLVDLVGVTAMRAAELAWFGPSGLLGIRREAVVIGLFLSRPVARPPIPMGTAEAAELRGIIRAALAGAASSAIVVHSADAVDLDPSDPRRLLLETAAAVATPTDSGEPTPQIPLAEVVALFLERGHELIDKRIQGGCLWVLGGRNLSLAMDELERAGLYFQYAPGGSRATGFRSAWYTR